MKLAQLDLIRCACGSREFRVEAKVVGEAQGPQIDEIGCRNFCAFRQCSVEGNGIRLSDCHQCRSRNVFEGALACSSCGQSWNIIDGLPSFASYCVYSDPVEHLQVVETDPQADPRWEAFVLAHPSGLIYHHPGWIAALEQEYGRKGVHLLCEDADGRALAVMPMLYTLGLPFNSGGRLAGRRLSSLPRTPVAGPLSTGQGATIALLRAAVQKASQNPGIELQIKTEGPELDGLVPNVVCTPWRLSYLLRLPECCGNPFRVTNSHRRATIKRAINKATRMGVRVRPAITEADVRQWYELYIQVMRNNAVPPRPDRFFDTVLGLLGPKGAVQLLLAEQHIGGKVRVVAGSIFLMLGQRVSYAFNGSRSSDLPLRANDLLHWEAINDACRKGFRCFDFGEVPEGYRDLAAFKGKWGAEPVRLYRYYYPASSLRPEVSGEQATGLARAFAEKVWQHLPTRAVEWLGDRLYSYL